MVVVLALLMIAFGLTMFMLFRASRVRDYRIKLIYTIYHCAKIDVQESKPWKWRYETFESVSYDNMLFRFWKPLTSFYKDKSFLE